MATSGRLRIATVVRGVALVGTVALTGCISTKSGSGPLASEKAVQAYGRPMGVLQAEERVRFERVAAKLPATPGKPLPYLRFCLGGAPKLEGQAAAKGVVSAIFTCGFWNAKARFVGQLTSPSDSVSLYTRENICIPGYPLVWPLLISGALGTGRGEGAQQVGVVPAVVVERQEHVQTAAVIGR
jgi:hypothetical protein